MKTELAPFLPPPLSPASARAWLLPDPTNVPEPARTPGPGRPRRPSGAGTIVQPCGGSSTAGQPFFLVNCWGEELIDGTHIGLGAGSGRWGYSLSFGFGLIIVDGCPGDYKNGAYKRFYGRTAFYEIPTNVGSTPLPTMDAQGRPPNYWLRIVDAEGERIHLVSQDGIPFVFDLATCHWVKPPVPTETAPPPTFTPVTPTATELPWYASIPPGEERDYVLKMEQLSSSVLTAVAMTPYPGRQPLRPPHRPQLRPTMLARA